jgi:ribosomal protein S17
MHSMADDVMHTRYAVGLTTAERQAVDSQDQVATMPSRPISQTEHFVLHDVREQTSSVRLFRL